MTESDNQLMLEKLNSQRITSLEERLERHVQNLDDKIGKVLEQVTKKDGSGAGSQMRIVGVVFGILTPFLILGGTLGFQLYLSADHRISTVYEELQWERDRINKLEKEIYYDKGQTEGHIHRLEQAENHGKILGHPTNQTARLDAFKERLDNVKEFLDSHHEAKQA